jgi:hypothetical protein
MADAFAANLSSSTWLGPFLDLVTFFADVAFFADAAFFAGFAFADFADFFTIVARI